MSFIFRTVFWLALAMVIVPPESRLGGGEVADFHDVDLALELHNVTYRVWSLAAGATNTCETNPQLCNAAADLWQTTWATAEKIAIAGDQSAENPEITLPPPAKSRSKPRPG